ncbi:hypothetical protein [Pontivivens insulae]|uniref:Uncharacterized protein n=1 Tax=Pontivivens insulae TaxID=1639689 RepID=A0A2R8AFW6_9RHOB|nr:hypothetical protein [Pontivivens insulae]RED12320.1 hypothetical protein DFR53_3039 [Pontivivens insulae]SPF31076.1 hypothetical protein POI8812_03427 [Pontivivens insulae]
MRLSLTMAVLVMAALPAKAQDLPPLPPELAGLAEDIPLGDWLDLVSGRTVFYRIGDDHFAREHYPPQGSTLYIEDDFGRCMEGQWTHIPETGAYCFDWPVGLYCFRHLRAEDDLLILPVTPDGVPTGSSVQGVYDIQTQPFTCDAPALS